MQKKELTGSDVTFETSLLYSTVTYFLPSKSNQKGNQKSNQKGNQKIQDRMLKLLSSDPSLSRKDLSTILGISQSTVQNYIRLSREQGKLIRIGGAKGGRWEVIADE